MNSPKKSSILSPNSYLETCLVCKSHRLYPLYQWQQVPLSVVHLASSKEHAQNAASLQMDLYRCANCGHVFNGSFDPNAVAYARSTNLVYNQGDSWSRYQDELAKEWLQTYDLKEKCIIEIGCGEGQFLKRFDLYGNRCIGFEPGEDAESVRQKGLEVMQNYFYGSALKTLPASALICRHVIEHLPDPLDFLQDIAMAAQTFNVSPLFMAEVPMIDKALQQCRMNDFLYEHVSNFSYQSFRTLFELAGYEVLEHQARYQDEVVTVVARPKSNPALAKIAASCEQFKNSIDTQINTVQSTFSEWRRQGSTFALWAATGKGAAFINMFGITPDIAPLVVDSDARKFGKFVPGTGQEIRSPYFLVNQPVDKIVILSNWHGRDIEREIRDVHQLNAELFVYFNGQITPLTAELPL